MSQTPIPDNVPGADEGTAEGLAAPGRAGAGGTYSSVSVLAIWVGSVIALIPFDAPAAGRNEGQWLSIADFLARQNLRIVLQGSACSAEGVPACGEGSAQRAAIIFGGYAGADTSVVPVGNTGTTSTGRGV